MLEGCTAKLGGIEGAKLGDIEGAKLVHSCTFKLGMGNDDWGTCIVGAKPGVVPRSRPRVGALPGTKPG